MGFSNLSSLKRVESYEDCAELFTKAGPLKRMGWHEDERPLKDSRSHHYRVKRNAECYDVILYSTVMARYFKPEGNMRKVWYNVDSRTTSSAFMHHVLRLWNARSYTTVQGPNVHIGLNLRASGLFPIRLTFVGGKLDLDNSVDAPEFMPATTSDERKQERKELRKWLRPFEAMVKIVEPSNIGIWQAAKDVEMYAGLDVDFDSSRIVECIRRHDLAKLVDQCKPLGDVQMKRNSFMKVSA